MPIPIREALTQQESSAAEKAEAVQRRLPQYLVQSVLAGAYVGVAVVLMLMVSAPFIKAGSVATKLLQGAVFGVALTLVVFAGAELFTGCVMTMTQGLLARKANARQTMAVLAASLTGNFIGAAGFAAIVAASGVVNAGAPKNEVTVFFAALGGIMKTKAGLTGLELFWRATLCNFLVCLGLWMAQRASSDGAKLICLWWALLAFVASGFEHSVANMTLFFLGIFTHAPYGTWHNLLGNLVFTVPGNILGGGLMVGAAYTYAASTPGRGRVHRSGPAWLDPPSGRAAGEVLIELDGLEGASAVTVETVTATAPMEVAGSVASLPVEPAPPRRRTSPPPRRIAPTAKSPARTRARNGN